MATVHPMTKRLEVELDRCGEMNGTLKQYTQVLRAAKKIPKGLRYKDKTPVPDEAIAYLKRKWYYDFAEELVKSFDQKTWKAAMNEILEWKNCGGDAGFMQMLIRFGDEDIITKLIDLYPTWKKSRSWDVKDMYQQFPKCMMISNTRAALLFAQKQNLLNEYAERQHTTLAKVQELLNALLFDANGVRIFHAGTDEIEASLQSDFSIQLKNLGSGEIINSFPKSGKPNDAKDFSEWAKKVADMVKVHIKTLKSDFAKGTALSLADWKTIYTVSSPQSMIGKGLLWHVIDGNYFRLNEKLKPVDAAGKAAKLPQGCSIQLAHPAEMDVSMLQEWKSIFHAIPQPFAQLQCPVRLPEPSTLEERYLDVYVHAMVLKGLPVYKHLDKVTMGGNSTVSVYINNRHDFSGRYPVIDVTVSVNEIANQRAYSTDILQMDTYLDPFSKAREAVESGKIKNVRHMVELGLILPENILEMLNLDSDKKKKTKPEITAFLLELCHQWGVAQEDQSLEM